MHSNGQLDSQDVDHYHEHGYLGPLTIMSAEDMAAIRQRIDQDILDRERDVPAATRNNDRHLDTPVIWELATHPILLQIARSLLGPDLLLWRSNFQIKEALAADGTVRSEEVPWHSDQAYYRLQPPVILTAWLAIDPVSRANGCMQIIPGSHLQQVSHHTRGTDTFNLAAEHVDQSRAIDLPMQAGQCVLMNENLLHHSFANHSTQRRFAISFRIIIPCVHTPRGGNGRPRDGSQPKQLALLCGEDRLGFYDIVKS